MFSSFEDLNTYRDLPAFIQAFSAAALCLLAFQGELWQVVGLVLAAGTARTCCTAQTPWPWPGQEGGHQHQVKPHSI